MQGAFSPLGQPALDATLEGSLTVTDGPHTLYAQVRDRAGQLASASVSFSVLTGPPVTPQSGFIHGQVHIREPGAPDQKEVGGRDGPDPVRYGDWEVKGVASDF